MWISESSNHLVIHLYIKRKLIKRFLHHQQKLPLSEQKMEAILILAVVKLNHSLLLQQKKVMVQTSFNQHTISWKLQSQVTYQEISQTICKISLRISLVAILLPTILDIITSSQNKDRNRYKAVSDHLWCNNHWATNTPLKPKWALLLNKNR